MIMWRLETRRDVDDDAFDSIGRLLADAAEEGLHVITGMLITGLVFVSVIALGQTIHWLRHRGH